MIADPELTVRLPRFGPTQREVISRIADLRAQLGRHAPGSITEYNRAREIRTLAAEGHLSGVAAVATPQWRTAIRGAAFSLAWPVVFQRLTRRIEIRRGHVACATSVFDMTPECLDRFYDDVEAVVVDLLKRANTPIRNLEGWIASRLNASTVDGHRRRRGELGALQRPRLPRWLADLLEHDPWLSDLAVQILQWVGVRTTAGGEMWPLDSWAIRRATQPDGPQGAYDTTLVARDVELVLSAMRTRPAWYADYVERPLGHKQAAVVLVEETTQLQFRDCAETDEQHLAELAAQAFYAIRERLHAGEDLALVVHDVLGSVFGGATGSHDLERPPLVAPDYERCVTTALSDPHQIDRVVAVVQQELVRATASSSMW
jgi:hypothetical protein